MQFETLGTGPRLVLVHGSVVGAAVWRPVRALADRYTLVLVTRPGFPPGPPVERPDFAVDAGLLCDVLRPGDHLVGASYGGVVTLLAAGRRPDLGSLTVIEPPAFALVEPERYARFVRHFADAAAGDLRSFLARFLELVGAEIDLPDPLTADLEQGARGLRAERPPWEARIPVAELAAAPYPKLVVSGGHSADLDAVCAALVDGIGAEYAVLPGAGHSAMRAPGFVERLAGFLARAEAAAADARRCGGIAPPAPPPPGGGCAGSRA